MSKTTAQTIEESIKTLIVSTCLLNAEASEFVPPPPGMSSWSLNAKSHGMNSDAKEFVPAQKIVTETVPAASTVVPLWYKKESNSHKGKFYYVHSKTGKTSWTLPEDYVEPIVHNVQVVSTSQQACMHSVSAINLAYLSDDSSSDDDDTDHEDTSRLLTGKQARERCLSPTASTSVGLSSDDESDSADEAFPEACLGDQKFRPPPGLMLPSSPSHLALGILARAGLSAEPATQQKLPPWRSTRTSKFTSSVSESTTWIAPWRREMHNLAAAA